MYLYNILLISDISLYITVLTGLNVIYTKSYSISKRVLRKDTRGKFLKQGERQVKRCEHLKVV